MKRFALGALLLSLTLGFAGCGNDDASVGEGYSESAPRAPGSGPTGTGGPGRKAKAGDSDMTAPAPPPL